MIVLSARAGTEHPTQGIRDAVIKRYFRCTVAQSLWGALMPMPHTIRFAVDIIPQSLPERTKVSYRERDGGRVMEFHASLFKRLHDFDMDGLQIMQGGDNVFEWLCRNARGKFSIYASDQLEYDLIAGTSDIVREGIVRFSDHRDAVQFAFAFKTE